MTRDKTHMNSVVRWAKFVKENPTKWQKDHADFINSVYEKAYNAIEKIKLTKNGKEKLKKIYNIKNEKGYPDLFS